MVEKLKKENGVEYRVGEICCGKGGKEWVWNGIVVLVNGGDEVIVGGRYWVRYGEMVKVGEGKGVIVRGGMEEELKIRGGELEGGIRGKRKGVIVCCGWNGRGCVYRKEELGGLVGVLGKDGEVIVIGDEIYEDMNYMGKEERIGELGEMKDGRVIVKGVWKGYGMRGWGIGLIGGGEWIVKGCKKLEGE